MSLIKQLCLVVLLPLLSCTAPDYLSVPPAVPVGHDRRLSPSAPDQAVVRDQHLGQLQVEARFLEEQLLRTEQERLQACRASEAAQPDSRAYQRCQLKDQRYEQLKLEVASARQRYLRAVSGRGG